MCINNYLLLIKAVSVILINIIRDFQVVWATTLCVCIFTNLIWVISSLWFSQKKKKKKAPVTHPVLSPWAPRPGGAGLAVLWGGGVTEEEVEPIAAELTGVMGHGAEGDELPTAKKRGGRRGSGECQWIVTLLPWQQRSSGLRPLLLKSEGQVFPPRLNKLLVCDCDLSSPVTPVQPRPINHLHTSPWRLIMEVNNKFTSSASTRHH